MKFVSGNIKIRFCSNACRAEPIGSKKVTPEGYILVKVAKEDPFRTTRSGWELEHRYVMAKHIGRTIRKNETVHHINGKRDDNSIENLELWCTPKNGNHGRGQRVSDLVDYVIENYSSEILAALKSKGILNN